MFLPSRSVDVGASSYRDDRGWSFDQQLVQNLGVFENRRLSDYSSLEELAVIPMMVLPSLFLLWFFLLIIYYFVVIRLSAIASCCVINVTLTFERCRHPIGRTLVV